MRRLRPLLLVAILLILAGVAVLYRTQKSAEQRQAPALPRPLSPLTTSAAPEGWVWSQQNEKGVDVIRLRAKDFKQLSNPPRIHLEGVELRLLSKDGASSDLFRTSSADFNPDQKTLYSDGPVEITTGEPVEGEPARRQVFIRTSGLLFDGKTGKASTTRPATFQFEGGEGKSVGASYDPNSRELRLCSQAEVIWNRREPGSAPMKVQAGELLYKENDSAIILSPWSRLTRGNMTVEAGQAFAWIQDGSIRRVEALSAHGNDQPDPNRQLDYAADHLYLDFADNGEVNKITGEGNARLASVDRSARTAMKANHLDLDFDVASRESRLQRALATGKSEVESRPLAAPGVPLRETRLLRSEEIELFMQPGGKEIRRVETRTPGVIEFLPNLPTQSRRRVEGERISINYGPENRIRSLSVASASTRTDPAHPPNRPAAPAMLTQSKELRAAFDPTSSELTQLDQWNAFRYEQGDRQGRADRGLFNARENRITLTGAARLWDPTGSVEADRLVLNQATGDVTAEGNVASTRQPERDTKKPAPLLSEGEPLHAKAAKMFMTDSQRFIRYEGQVVLWQGGNRIEAERVEIDRGKQTLTARGNVRSQFVERATAGKNRPPVFTLIQSPELVYSEKTETAQCRGGVVMTRAGTVVRSDELRGVFVEKDNGSELDKAYADGQVRIVRAEPDHIRQGSAEHAVYIVAENKIVLTGGAPEFTDSLKGSTRGTQLTWFADNDRLLVDGREGQPAVSRLRRK